MLITIKRVFKSGMSSFSRDGGVALATIFVLSITVFLASSIFLLRSASQFLISTLEEKADISVYFKEDSPEEDILNIREELSKIPEVKNVKYISKEEALENFIERHKENPLLMQSLEEVGRNPFLASLNIKAWKANQYEKIVNFLENPTFQDLIEKVDFYQRKSIIERIFSLSSFLQKTVLLLSFISIILAFLITFNTIRLAILNSSEEIKIQRLVGASNWFIRGPFLVQGAISGTLAALISLVIFSLACWVLNQKIEFLFSGLNIFSLLRENLKPLILIQFITGTGLGVMSSFFAIRKYLKI